MMLYGFEMKALLESQPSTLSCKVRFKMIYLLKKRTLYNELKSAAWWDLIHLLLATCFRSI